MGFVLKARRGEAKRGKKLKRGSAPEDKGYLGNYRQARGWAEFDLNVIIEGFCSVPDFLNTTAAVFISGHIQSKISWRYKKSII